MNYSLLLQLLVIPLISAFIGWFTNWIAIKMLFHPKDPKRILGITFHGIFPKRQKIFAEKLGKMISVEFLSFEDIEQKITHPENLQKLMPMIDDHVDNFLRNKLSDEMPFLSLFIGDKTIRSLKKDIYAGIGNSISAADEKLCRPFAARAGPRKNCY